MEMQPPCESQQAHKVRPNQEPIKAQSAGRCAHLHLVDVGGVVPAAAQRGAGFAAAVGDHPALRFAPRDVAARQPVAGAAAAAALQLRGGRERVINRAARRERERAEGAGAYVLLQPVHGQGDVLLPRLGVVLRHGQVQVLLQLLAHLQKDDGNGAKGGN